MFLWRERDVWDQLRQRTELLAGANELLSVWSAEVEDLRLRCADMKAEAAMAREQAAPLVARMWQNLLNYRTHIHLSLSKDL